MKAWVRELASRKFPKGEYSQGGQDGILAEIFRHVPTANVPPFCVEFGFNADSLDGGSGANVARLVLKERWRALLLDGSHENPSINLHREFLTSANIEEVFTRHGVPSEPDYVSIDLDTTDLWIFRSLLHHYRAAVYSVEYNSHFPLGAAITFPDDPAERWERDRGYGASLEALALVAVENGYSLVAVEPWLDAFFVRNDLIDDGSGTIAPPLEHYRDCTGLVKNVPLKRRRRAGIFLDYRVWRDSGGDLKLARSAAAANVRQHLLAGWWMFKLRSMLLAAIRRVQSLAGQRHRRGVHAAGRPPGTRSRRPPESTS
jgi:hypothetical protein